MADLLDVLDAIVRADRGPSAIRGTIAFVVRESAGARAWYARFDGRKVSTRFAETVPDDASAVILLGEREAEALARGGSVSPGSGSIVGAGDRALMLAFVARYLGAKSWLEVRAGASANGVAR
jgi:hypothetical protein